MTIATGTGTTDLTATAKRLYMLNVVDTTTSPGAAAWVILRDGGAAGTQVLNVRVAALDSKTLTFPQNRPLLFPVGLYVQVAGGTGVRWSVDVA